MLWTTPRFCRDRSMRVRVVRIAGVGRRHPDVLLSHFLTAFTVRALDIDRRRVYANQNSIAPTVDG